MLKNIPENLKSRKLWAFIGAAILVIANYVFKLGMPTEDVIYLVSLASVYILGQGYVDAKRQPVKEFPVDDFTNSISNIIQAELSKLDFSKNVPMEKVIEGLTPIMKQVLGNLTFTLATPATQTEPTTSTVVSDSVPAADQVQQTA